MSTLTQRELEVLRLTAEGLPGKRIATALGVGLRCVRVHQQNIREKIDCRNSIEMSLYAIRNGLYCPWCDL